MSPRKIARFRTISHIFLRSFLSLRGYLPNERISGGGIYRSHVFSCHGRKTGAPSVLCGDRGALNLFTCICLRSILRDRRFIRRVAMLRCCSRTLYTDNQSSAPNRPDAVSPSHPSLAASYRSFIPQESFIVQIMSSHIDAPLPPTLGETPEAPINKRIILLGAIAAFGGMLFGYDGVSGDIKLVIQTLLDVSLASVQGLSGSGTWNEILHPGSDWSRPSDHSASAIRTQRLSSIITHNNPCCGPNFGILCRGRSC
jgi:hypothetical protein